MTVVVPHQSTQQATIATLDSAADQLLAGAGSSSVKIADQKKTWAGPVMSFSFTGKVGFISIPLAGTVMVDDANVTVECELPPMLKNFVGEEKIRSIVGQKIKELAQPA